MSSFWRASDSYQRPGSFRNRVRSLAMIKTGVYLCVLMSFGSSFLFDCAISGLWKCAPLIRDLAILLRSTLDFTAVGHPVDHIFSPSTFRSAGRSAFSKKATTASSSGSSGSSSSSNVPSPKRIFTVELGDPISSVLTFRNDTKDEKRTVDVQMEMHILSYDGVRRTKLAAQEKQVVLDPNQQEQLLLQARDSDYVPHIKEHSQIAVDVMAHVNETAQVYSQRDLFTIKKPDLVLKVTSVRENNPQRFECVLWFQGEPVVRVNTPTTISIYFANPTNQILTNCGLKLEGSGLYRASGVKIPSRLAGRATMQLQYSIVPRRKGQRSLLAVFNSDQVSNIRGTCIINVT